MNFKRISILLAASAVVFTGCISGRGGGPGTLKLVGSVLSDTTSAVFKASPDVNRDFTNGTIAVIGSSSDALAITEGLLTCDSRNNISGAAQSDGLPDFSGETVSLLIDEANAPYQDYLSLGNEMFLRELNVRNFLWAVDTVVLRSPFDGPEGIFKQRAKIVVLASSFASAYGYEDVDTLCRAAKVSLPVFAPVQSMTEYAYSRHEGIQNIAIWTTDRIKDAGVYAKCMPEEFSARNDGASTYEVFCPAVDTLPSDGLSLWGEPAGNEIKSRLLDLFDSYIASGKTSRLTSLFLDDETVSYEALLSIVEDIKRTDEDNMLVYRNILSPDFRVITPGLAIAEQCYDYLRKYNQFTHRIAYPDMKAYLTVPSANLPENDYALDGSLSYAFKYSREEGGEGSGHYTFVSMRDRYVSDSLLEYMSKCFPKTFSLYVR